MSASTPASPTREDPREAARTHDPAARAPVRPPAFDYVTVGHVTVDVLPDGSRRPGGTAL